jgi:glycolate oxidase FAD binding subunit
VSPTAPEAVLAGAVPESSLGSFRLRDERKRPLVSPRSDEEWTSVLEVARAEGWRCLIAGSGSRLAASPVPEDVDVVLSTRSYEGIVAYEPGDGTVTARAGTSMASLREHVSQGGHHLTPDVSRPDRRTLGGVVATATSGFDRLRHGPVRDHVLGTRVLLADGSIARSGGRLVKNVTGYDLHRLYTGSHGTLCIVLEASLRLTPAPRARAAVFQTRARRADALEDARRVLAEPVRPTAVAVRGGTGSEWELGAFLAGREDVVAWERERLLGHLPEPRVVPSADEPRLRLAWRDEEGAEPRRPTLRIATRPSRLGPALEALEQAALERDLAWEATLHPGIATALVRFDADVDPRVLVPVDAAVAGIGESRRAPLVRRTWFATPGPLAEAGDVFAVPSPGLPLARRLQAALDPGGLFVR